MARSRFRILLACLASLLIVTSACSSSERGAVSTTTTVDGEPATNDPRPSVGTDSRGDAIPELLVEIPDGELSSDLVAQLDAMFDTIGSGVNPEALEAVATSQDPRLAWLLTDMLRFINPDSGGAQIGVAFNRLTGADIDIDFTVWNRATNLMIAWDVPAPPDYVRWKGELFTLVEPGWAPFFEDADATIDWRLVSWGGVLIDARPLDEVDTPCPRGCIPALDDPAVTDADGGSWYPDEAIVFGVTINGESRAYPKHQMEVHEMINDTLGDRRIGMPYCTLCGSAQAYYTDQTERFETLELRTSGLLSRSNKVMYEFHTSSVFDTFTGEAVTGPLREQGVQLEPVTVITSTWADWKDAHPDTTIIAEDGGLGRSYSLDPLRGRDDNGPIFPIGDVDGRLQVQELVLGVKTPDGGFIAFPAAAARDALANGDEVTAAGVTVTLDGGAGLLASTGAGDPLPTNESFWFAWSQFHPETEVWTS